MVEDIRREHPQAQVEVWAQDDARLGLKPIVRRVWARRGERPKALQRPRYQWLYLYGFVRPTTGQTHWLILPTVSAAVYQLALTDFAEAQGAGPDKRIVLVVDGAGFHVSKDIVVPDGIHLVYLPPYSPQLQPSERLWPLVHEALANRAFDSLDELEDVLAQRCRALDDRADLIRRYTKYHWWVDDTEREISLHP